VGLDGEMDVEGPVGVGSCAAILISIQKYLFLKKFKLPDILALVFCGCLCKD
jgi:hypothetical protein